MKEKLILKEATKNQKVKWSGDIDVKDFNPQCSDGHFYYKNCSFTNLAVVINIYISSLRKIMIRC